MDGWRPRTAVDEVHWTKSMTRPKLNAFISISLTNVGRQSILQSGLLRGNYTSISRGLASSRGPGKVLAGTPSSLIIQITYLQLNPGLRNILLAAATIHNLLRLRDLGPDCVRAKIFKGVALDRVDAQDGVGLHNSEASGDYDGLL